jgi:hypothetical protein
MTEKERELGWMRQQMEIHERERANLEKQLLEKDRQLELLLRSKDKDHQEAAGKVENIKLTWREGKTAPLIFLAEDIVMLLLMVVRYIFKVITGSIPTTSVTIIGCDLQNAHLLAQFSMVN